MQPLKAGPRNEPRLNATSGNSLEYLFNTIVVLHFLGLAALIGGFLVQIKSHPRQIYHAMFDGALTLLVTGLLLVGLLYPLSSSDPDEFSTPNNAKIAVKLSIVLIVVVLTAVNRKKPEITTAIWGLIGGLSILNVVIAVFWH